MRLMVLPNVGDSQPPIEQRAISMSTVKQCCKFWISDREHGCKDGESGRHGGHFVKIRRTASLAGFPLIT
jgi:hypothetical protein